VLADDVDLEHLAGFEQAMALDLDETDLGEIDEAIFLKGLPDGVYLGVGERALVIPVPELRVARSAFEEILIGAVEPPEHILLFLA
jgi:hypothetical protein